MIVGFESLFLVWVLSSLIPLVLAWRGRRGALDPTFLWFLSPLLAYLLGVGNRIAGQAALLEGLKSVPANRWSEVSHQTLPLTMTPELATAGSLVFVFVGMILVAIGLIWYRRHQQEVETEQQTTLLWLTASSAIFVVLATWRFLAIQTRIWLHDAFCLVDPELRVKGVDAALKLESSVHVAGAITLVAMLGFVAFLLHRAGLFWPLRRTKNGVIIIVMLIVILSMAGVADHRDRAFALELSPKAASALVNPVEPDHRAGEPESVNQR